MDGTWPDPARFGASTEFPALPLGVYWLANLVCYGFGEEVGCRGFAQPHLERRRSALRAATVLRVVLGRLALPLLGITATYRAMPLVGFAGFILNLLVASWIFAWLWHGSAGSLLVVAVFDTVSGTPTSTTRLPTLMGAAVTVVGLAVVPRLARLRAVPGRSGQVSRGGGRR